MGFTDGFYVRMVFFKDINTLMYFIFLILTFNGDLHVEYACRRRRGAVGQRLPINEIVADSTRALKYDYI